MAARAGGNTKRSLELDNELRINREHVMNSMEDEMQISYDFWIRKIAFRVEYVSMDKILA